MLWRRRLGRVWFWRGRIGGRPRLGVLRPGWDWRSWREWFVHRGGWRSPGFARVVVCAGLVVLCFRQEPGRLAFDTKLDLAVDPVSFLHRAVSLWEPEAAFGQLQDQAYGYLFPIGPFYALGQLLHLPMWAVHRAWMSVLFVLAFTGTVRLARRLGVGSEWSRIVAGLAYALSPRALTVVGPVSAEALAMVLLPWVMLPLVRGAREGSPRRAAGLSAVGVLCMGAVNATVTVAVLVLPALWLLTRPNGPRKWRLTAWWAGLVSLACLWWVIPLLLFTRYSPPFVDFVESAANTTATTSLFQVLRGTSYWVAYVVVGDEPWWRSGWTLATQPGVVAATAVVAGLGMVGLAARRLPYRPFVAGGLLLGLAVITFGHTGPLTPPWAGYARHLLDGPLVPFRNIHRFDPVLRLPLALGLAHLLALVPGRLGRGLVRRVPLRRVAAAAAALTVAGVATPALAGDLLTSRTFAAIPPWWKETARYLAETSHGQRALLVPATGFAQYRWGQLVDEPMQPLARSPWAVRNQIPLGSLGNIRMLDAIEDQLATGRGSPGLAGYLARSGVKHLVVRNDIDWVRAGAVRPAVVHAALATSPGLARVAAFGPPVGGEHPGPGEVSDFGVDLSYPAVEIYAVTGEVSQVATYPVRGSFVVSGGPESVLHMLDAGLLGDRATMLAGDDATVKEGMRWAVTDGLRRREIDVGRVSDHASATLTPDDPLRLHRKTPDILPVSGQDHQTTAGYAGAESVHASSAASDPGARYLAGPAHLPFAAFDGDPSTSWISSAPTGPLGQWVEITFDRWVSLSQVTVRMVDSPLVGSRVTLLRVQTAAGSMAADILPGEREQVVPVPPGRTNRLRLTVESVIEAGRGTGLVGIREVRIPGVRPQRTLVAPEDARTLPVLPGSDPPVYVFSRAGGGRTGCVPAPAGQACSPELGRTDEEAVALDRTFFAAASRGLRITGTVRAKGGAALDALLRPRSSLDVTASSTLVRDPAVRPGAAADKDTYTSWVAGLWDPTPWLRFSWRGKRTLSELQVLRDAQLVAATPTRLRLTSPAGTRDVVVTPGRTTRFRPLVTDRVTVTFTGVVPLTSRNPVQRTLLPVPVGVSELRFPALDGLVRPVDPAAPVGRGCGTGPDVTVDEYRFATRVAGTVADVLADRPLRLVPCPRPGNRGTPAVAVLAGTHRVRATDTAAFTVASIALSTPAGVGAVAASPRTTTVERWDAEDRVVRVGPGAQSFLVVRENANPGWTATLDGLPLPTVRVDGWQQGWVLPEGTGGEVHLRFTPGHGYRLGLLAGALAVLAMLVLTFLPARRDPPPPLAAEAAGRGVPVLTLVALAAVAVVLCGPVGLLAPGAAVLLRLARWPGWAVTAAAFGVATAVVVSGVLATGGQGIAGGWVVQSLCLAAVTGVMVRLLPDRSVRMWRPPNRVLQIGRGPCTSDLSSANLHDHPSTGE